MSRFLAQHTVPCSQNPQQSFAGRSQLTKIWYESFWMLKVSWLEFLKVSRFLVFWINISYLSQSNPWQLDTLSEIKLHEADSTSLPSFQAQQILPSRSSCTMNVRHSRWKQKKQWRDRGLQWKRQGFHKKVLHYHELSLLSQTKVGTQKRTTSMVHQSPSQFVPRTTCPAPKVVSEQLSSLSSLKSSSNSLWSSKTHLSEEQLDLEINFGGWWKLSPGAL